MKKALNILLVDDEEDAAFLFRQKFRKEIREENINLHVAKSGEEALELLQSLHSAEPLLILSDINMPGMSGIELLQKIKASYPMLRVVMVSAYGNNSGYLTDAKKFGADDFIPKPLDFDMLKDKYISNEEN